MANTTISYPLQVAAQPSGPLNLTMDPPEGTLYGQSASDLIGFYGATPIAQQSAITAVTTTGATTSTPYGYTTSAQANGLVTAVNALITAMTNLGLIA